MYELGDIVTLTLHIRDPETGLPPIVAEEPTTVVCTITLPDTVTTATPTITHTPGSGDWSIAYPSTVTGLHQVRWVATGLNSGTHDDSFNIERSVGLLVSQAEALAHLRGASQITRAADLDQLRWLCRLATDMVEADLNRVLVRRQITETIPYGGAMWLPAPLESVTDVSIEGVVQDPGTYRYDTGRLTFPYGMRYAPNGTTVTYIAGDENPPTIARQVALRGIQRAWQQSQQMPHPALDDLGAESNLFTPVGTLTPLEMMAYQRLRIPVIA